MGKVKWLVLCFLISFALSVAKAVEDYEVCGADTSPCPEASPENYSDSVFVDCDDRIGYFDDRCKSDEDDYQSDQTEPHDGD